LKGSNGPASAIGAKVIVEYGDRKQVLVNQWATTYLSYNDPRLHIGLGKSNMVDNLEIYWLNGQTEIYKNLNADRYITIKQGIGIQ
jgi:hypothetical protein